MKKDIHSTDFPTIQPAFPILAFAKKETKKKCCKKFKKDKRCKRCPGNKS